MFLRMSFPQLAENRRFHLLGLGDKCIVYLLHSLCFSRCECECWYRQQLGCLESYPDIRKTSLRRQQIDIFSWCRIPRAKRTEASNEGNYVNMTSPMSNLVLKTRFIFYGKFSLVAFIWASDESLNNFGASRIYCHVLWSLNPIFWLVYSFVSPFLGPIRTVCLCLLNLWEIKGKVIMVPFGTSL